MSSLKSVSVLASLAVVDIVLVLCDHQDVIHERCCVLSCILEALLMCFNVEVRVSLENVINMIATLV